MNYELAIKCVNGELDPKSYSVVNTVEELIDLIDTIWDGFLIRKDAPCGSGFGFTLTEKGPGYGYRFHSDRFLSTEDKKLGKENPDYHSVYYKTAAEGVAHFKINGKPLIEAVKGRRFFANDVPCPEMSHHRFPDKDFE